MNCPDCTQAARTWNWHGYRGDCPDCQIRAIAQAPRNLREIRYEQIRREAGIEAMEAIKERVRDEYARIQLLKGNS